MSTAAFPGHRRLLGRNPQARASGLSASSVLVLPILRQAAEQGTGRHELAVRQCRPITADGLGRRNPARAGDCDVEDIPRVVEPVGARDDDIRVDLEGLALPLDGKP